MPDSPRATPASPVGLGQPRQRLRELSHLIRSFSELVIVVDEHLHVVECDGPVERLWGIERAELLGETIPTMTRRLALLDGEGGAIPIDHAPTARALAAGHAQVDPIIGIRRPDGSVRWAHVVATPTPAADGRPGGVTSIWTDLTPIVEHDTSEERVRERTAVLESTVAELEAFSYTVSHDLRGPSRAIGTMVDVLLEQSGERLDDDGRELLGRIRDTASRMDALTSVLLELAAVARAEPRRVPLDLGAIAREELAALQAAQRDRVVRCDVDDALCASADESLVRVVLHNLLSNAWKFTAPRHAGHIHVGARDVDGEPVFFVHDNGVGFDPADADRLFLPFERLHREHAFEGTGVGLATVRRVIARHDGRVWAEGVPGRGATFFFTLAPPPVTTACALLADGAER